jgi:acetyl-CoA acetyltransferase
MAWITGVARTPFGRQPGCDALGWQAAAGYAALADAGILPADVDAMLVGYATTRNHLMPASLLAEYLGAQPRIALGASAGGATGLAMIAQATHLVEAGAARTVLVAAGEDRASGQSRATSTATLAQVGHPDYEVALGGNVPAYYALLASAYLARYGLGADALAPLAVQMRTHAAGTEGAHLRKPITRDDVRAARIIATPLTLLDCCPVSDGGAAVVVSAEPAGPAAAVRIAGLGQANRHQHLIEADLSDTGGRRSAAEALGQAGLTVADISVAGIYDSFTITLAMLLEEIGFAPPGEAGALAAAGEFSRAGRLPLNTHGGLLSYGHCGVAGGMAHVTEAVGALRQSPAGTSGLVHADGGVLSAHVSAVLTADAR